MLLISVILYFTFALTWYQEFFDVTLVEKKKNENKLAKVLIQDI